MIMRQSKRRANKDRGFTMIEMVFVLIVLVIMAAVFMSRYVSTGTNELMIETDGLKTSLRYAQIHALNDDVAKWGIHFTNDGTSYILYKNGTPALDINGHPVMIPVKGQTNDSGDPVTVACPENCHKLRGNVRITSVSGVGGGTTLNFDKWGIPLDSSNSPLNSNITLTLTKAGEAPAHITVTKNTGFIQ
jgi:prepilin-type N-terminal cleavage/methylation domain-containing protein